MSLVMHTKVEYRILDNMQTEFHEVQSPWLLEGLTSIHASEECKILFPKFLTALDII